MKPRFLKAKNIFAFFSIMLLCVISFYFMTAFAHFPNQIKLVEGYASELRADLPLQATIEAESDLALKVNNEPVNHNITIDLGHLNKIEAGQSGSATMTLEAFGIPLKHVSLDILPDMELVPCGLAVGVKVTTDGVMVLGTGSVNGEDGRDHKPSDGILKSGDLIIKANNEILKTKEQLSDIIKESKHDIQLEVKRKDQIFDTKVTPAVSKNGSENQIGAWVRDGTQGIGTITYYNPATNRFAALGHGILDVDTKQMMDIKNGHIKTSEIRSAVKGKKGAPGELIGDMSDGSVIGKVECNSPFGIFGSVNMQSRAKFSKQKMPIGLADTVHAGPAQIRATVDTGEPKTYDIFIESVNRGTTDDTRGMVIRITDPDLLAKTGGIVQGMSGSPIMQDNRLIGAVTHVFVQDPAKGYGIFIQNMLKHELSL